MAGVSNLKINECWNIRIGKIASGTEYPKDEQFQNSSILGIAIVFQIVKLWKFVNFHQENFINFKIPNIPSLENKPIFQILQFQKVVIF